MKSIPMLFSREMVEAILSGRKTVTRRLLNPQPFQFKDGTLWNFGNSKWKENHGPVPVAPESSMSREAGVPVGGFIWVKETWAAPAEENRLPPRCLIPDRSLIHYFAGAGDDYEDAPFPVGKTRPNLFMPKWASRLTLRVLSVHVERLQDITEGSAIEEGASMYTSNTKILRPFEPEWKGSYRRGFQALWDNLNGVESWDANPWVWVYRFKRVPGNVLDVVKGAE